MAKRAASTGTMTTGSLEEGWYHAQSGNHPQPMIRHNFKCQNSVTKSLRLKLQLCSFFDGLESLFLAQMPAREFAITVLFRIKSAVASYDPAQFPGTIRTDEVGRAARPAGRR